MSFEVDSYMIYSHSKISKKKYFGYVIYLLRSIINNNKFI